MSSSARDIANAANAANAQLSTGPVTEEGKAKSSQNARKHGLTAQDLVIPFEDREEFEEMLAEYKHYVSHNGPIQQAVFDELVSSAWNLRRIRRMETALSSKAASYLELLDDEATQKKLERLARHKTRIERTFHRSLKELKALHTNVALVRTLPTVLTDEAPYLTSAIEIAKRSQTLQRGGNEGMLRCSIKALDVDAKARKTLAEYEEIILDLEKQLDDRLEAPKAAA